VRLSDGVERLHDVATDVRELANLATQRPEEVAALRGAWEAIDATTLPYPG